VDNPPGRTRGQAADGVFDEEEDDEEDDEEEDDEELDDDAPEEEPAEPEEEDGDLSEPAVELVDESLVSFFVAEPLPPASVPADSFGVLRESVR
jgi:hypothetical protein